MKKKISAAINNFVGMHRTWNQRCCREANPCKYCERVVTYCYYGNYIKCNYITYRLLSQYEVIAHSLTIYTYSSSVTLTLNIFTILTIFAKMLSSRRHCQWVLRCCYLKASCTVEKVGIQSKRFGPLLLSLRQQNKGDITENVIKFLKHFVNGMENPEKYSSTRRIC